MHAARCHELSVSTWKYYYCHNHLDKMCAGDRYASIVPDSKLARWLTSSVVGNMAVAFCSCAVSCLRESTSAASWRREMEPMLYPSVRSLPVTVTLPCVLVEMAGCTCPRTARSPTKHPSTVTTVDGDMVFTIVIDSHVFVKYNDIPVSLHAAMQGYTCED